MLALLLAAHLVAVSPAHAATACSDLHGFTPASDTGLLDEPDWEGHTQRALQLLANESRPDCAKELASGLRAALAVAHQEGGVSDGRAEELQAKLKALYAVANPMARGWLRIRQGRPEQAQYAAQEAATAVPKLSLWLNGTQQNRLDSQANDLWRLAEDAADTRKALSAGDVDRGSALADELWTLAESWCDQGRLGEPQCEAMGAEAATLLAKADSTEGSREVPYLFQGDNDLDPHVSGANTCVAMLLAHFGAKVDPDEITRAWGHRYADKPVGLASVFNDQAVKHGVPARLIPHAQGSMAELDEQLAAGIPTIVHGAFATGGHAVLALRKDGSTYRVNDPGGRWSQSYEGGYGYSTPSDGKAVRYDGNPFRRAVATYDGINGGPVAWHEIRKLD